MSITDANAKKPPVQELDPEEHPLVTVLHRTWMLANPVNNQPFVPADRVTYLDRHTFVGGVARNVPHETAKQWVKLALIDKHLIFPNDAQVEDFSERTGRIPLSAQDFGATLMSPEKAAAILGDKQAEAFAEALLKVVSDRKRGRK